MSLKLCPKCERPFMASEEFCPRCPEPAAAWNQDSWGNMGCLLLTFLPLVVLIFFWLFFFLEVFYKIAARILSE